MDDHSIIHTTNKKKISFVHPHVSTYPAKSLKTLSIPHPFIKKYSFSHEKCLMVRKILDSHSNDLE